MVHFLMKNNLFALEQFAFQKNVHAITTVIDYIREEIDNKTMEQACFNDLWKAVDTLDHSILLKKIYALGYRGAIFEISSEYFRIRFQYIKSDNDEIERLLFNTGVSQRSIFFHSSYWSLLMICQDKLEIKAKLP